MTLRASWFSSDIAPQPVLRPSGPAVPGRVPLTWSRWTAGEAAAPVIESVQPEETGLSSIASMAPIAGTVEVPVSDPVGLAELAMAMERSVRALSSAHAAFLEQSEQSDRLVERMLQPWLASG